MRAAIGDRIVIRAHRIGEHDRDAEVLDTGPNGAPPFRVKWDDTGHEGLFFPSVDAYVRQAHAFITNPPAGTETARRRNGDTLFYHAASNTFAVATSDGAPRTMFKPDEGAAYWAEQQASLERQSGEG